jgi:Flp pilus assembly protein TadG
MTSIERLKRRLSRQEGAAAVEFAIVAMVFLLFLYGIITYGFIFGLDQSINHAAEEGARAAISQPTEALAISYATSTAINRLSWLGANIQPGDVVATVDDCLLDTSVRCITVTITYPWATRPLVPKLATLPQPSQMVASAVVGLT